MWNQASYNRTHAEFLQGKEDKRRKRSLSLMRTTGDITRNLTRMNTIGTKKDRMKREGIAHIKKENNRILNKLVGIYSNSAQFAQIRQDSKHCKKPSRNSVLRNKAISRENLVAFI